ncbi:MAG: dynamin [Hydrococcus sp. CRU_1_1]|nr:dynamin [Hydrococcus sp. CRU_1_1]
MQQQQVFGNLANYLKSIIGTLELAPDSQLRKDVLTICNFCENPVFRISVFGPFNYGKSTLLNALLGDRTLPIDLIPTTGAAIRVCYGDELRSRIFLKDGREINELGTDLLKRYAILDDQRCMRGDVESVEVCCNHPFLKTGVEFLDLPGTNDREAQDKLVRDRLLTADLIVQVLDARKLMTLGERENLRDWLQDRGIQTVIFVVNFLNLLEPDEQKDIHYRLRFVAESFRSQLPPGVSNLYRVDALPALRARLKGDNAAAQTTGLAAFESALQTIVNSNHEKLDISLPRVQVIVEKVKQVAEKKKDAIASELETIQQKYQTTIELKQKANQLIKQGFQRSLSDFQGWLYLPRLLSHYKAEIAISLQQDKFYDWFKSKFEPIVFDYQKQIDEWVKKGCDFFEKDYPEELSLTFPNPPVVSRASNNQESSSTTFSQQLDWVFDSSIGAILKEGASYIFSKTKNVVNNSEVKKTSTPDDSLTQIYAAAAENYLTCFSKEAFSSIRLYEEKIEQVLSFQIEKEPKEIKQQSYQLQLLNGLIESLEQELEDLKSSQLN